MPLYEYQCHDCNTRFERIEKVSAPSDGVCPSCGGAARRLLGAPALQFKGSGWYVTDYGKGNGGSPASTGESNHEVKSETKTDTAAKTESSTKSNSSTKSESTPKSATKVA
jgi:putative FmdB family regulatory protein